MIHFDLLHALCLFFRRQIVSRNRQWITNHSRARLDPETFDHLMKQFKTLRNIQILIKYQIIGFEDNVLWLL